MKEPSRSSSSSSERPPPPSLIQRQLTSKLASPQVAEKLQRQVTSHPPSIGTAGEHVMELEWEEWDGSDGSCSFLQHCLAGSFAGVAEHTLLYPLDTIKTQMQAYCANTYCPAHQNPTNKSIAPTGMLSTMRQLTMTTSENTTTTSTLATKDIRQIAGFGRLWRGVQTMMVGCIPAHALYFSTYEFCKSFFVVVDDDDEKGENNNTKNLGPLGSAVAGATAALSHDVIMTPADTVKQRLQLGHYHGMSDAFRNILSTEGPVGLYRSFPITLATNLPYGMIMVTTNEHLREILSNYFNTKVLDVKTTMLAGMGAGMVAAAVTTPLDRLKTRLQTQGLSTILNTTTDTAECKGMLPCAKATAAEEEAMLSVKPRYQGLSDAFQSIVREEGWIGLFRGMTPRVLTHTPAIAISWTTYEAAKMWLIT